MKGDSSIWDDLSDCAGVGQMEDGSTATALWTENNNSLGVEYSFPTLTLHVLSFRYLDKICTNLMLCLLLQICSVTLRSKYCVLLFQRQPQ